MARKMRKEFPSIIRIIVIVIGLFALIISIIHIFQGDIFKLSNDKLIFSSAGKLIVTTFIISIAAILASILLETNSTSNKIKEIGGTVSDQYAEISSKFMVFPGLKNIIRLHYDYLEELHSLAGFYKTNEDLFNLFERYLHYWFDIFIDKDLGTCIAHLNNFNFILERIEPDIFREFIKLFLESVRKDGTIKVTSIVKPPPEGNFWHQAADYLEAQKKLIQKRKAHIFRYFIIIENHYDNLSKLEKTINDNINSGIKTRVVLFKNKDAAGFCYRDVGIVDNLMTVENEINNGNVIKTHCHIVNQRNKDLNESVKSVFLNLDKQKDTIKLEKCRANFMKIIRERIMQLGT